VTCPFHLIDPYEFGAVFSMIELPSLALWPEIKGLIRGRSRNQLSRKR
jgi:hypothetical protein